MNSSSLLKYKSHLDMTVSWILKSIENGAGGSAAYYSPLTGWSKPYPETTGYLITTLIDTEEYVEKYDVIETATRMGDWLLSIQNPLGWWPGGLYSANAVQHHSIFNTAQILDGLCALSKRTQDSAYVEAGEKASRWLASGVNEGGSWNEGNYVASFNPSYYTQVAWPMLMAWELGIVGGEVRDAAIRVLDRIAKLRKSNGSIEGWGFKPRKAAFTHTIAYTIRGFVESAIILGRWEDYGKICVSALNRLARKSEFSDGRLPGAYTEDWDAVDHYTCLTGNAQVAICLLRLEEQGEDLRLVNSATKLIDYVCASQPVTANKRGAVAGSRPLWGPYMFMRYPNWAAKYHVDSLVLVIKRLLKEGLVL